MMIYYELIIVIGFVLFNIKATKKIGKFIMIVTAAIVGIQFVLIFGTALLALGCQVILVLLRHLSITILMIILIVIGIVLGKNGV